MNIKQIPILKIFFAINNFELAENYVLISLDIVSLFTNIPLNLVNKLLKEKWLAKSKKNI